MNLPVYSSLAASLHGSAADRLKQVAVAEEVPVALVYNGVSHAVMMTTPADLEDFALGFSLSEGLIEHPGELLDLETEDVGTGIEARIAVTARRFAALAEQHRSMEGRTGCGICGVESLAQAVRPVRTVRSGFRVAPGAIQRALHALPERQVLNQLTRSLHAAAWVDQSGAIRLVREDVGRHNALDKLIGAIAAAGATYDGGFALLTSRCSFELVQKAMMVGIPVLAAISAPTALAVRLAEEAGIGLVAIARPDGHAVFANAARLQPDPETSLVVA
jgi:formate dehydrogenase accessory protein FdhD